MMRPPPEPVDVYFYLSHVRNRAPDPWIQRFYQMLDTAVHLRARPTPGLRVDSIYLDTAVKAAQEQSSGALPRARVVVPLYTREFLHDPPPEYDEFERARRNGARHPCLHPVLWDANPGTRHALGLHQARSLGHGVADYEECGLAAMCRLTAFAEGYRQIVDRLAERIVAAAEHPEVEPSWAHDDGDIPEASAEARFVISVLAADGLGWDPFPGTESSPLARHAADVAARLRLLPEVVAYDPEDPVVRDSPGVLLIDLWALDSEAHESLVRTALEKPPRWAGVVAVLGSRGQRPAARRRALAMFAAELARQPVRAVVEQRDLVRELDDVVQYTRRSFLRGHPPHPHSGGERP